MTVLYLSYDGLTDPLGQSQILPYLRGLSAFGHDITVVSFEKPLTFSVAEKYIREQCLKAGLTWKPLVYHKSPPVFSTFFDLLTLSRKAGTLHKKKNFQIVHCRSYITSLVGARLQRTKGIRFIFDMRGFWADERIEGGLWNKRNPLLNSIYSFFKAKERDFIRSADYIISLTQNGRAEITKWGAPPDKTEVIPTCVDLDLFNHDSIDADHRAVVCERLGLASGEFILTYLGSLGTWYMMAEMIAFFDVLKKYRSSAKFLVISQDAWTFGKRADIVTVHVSRQDVPLYLSLASAAVFFIRPTFSKKASSATKTGELLAMGLPVVCNSGWGDIDEMKGKETGITVIDDFTTVAYERAAIRLLACEFDRTRLRQSPDL